MSLGSLRNHIEIRRRAIPIDYPMPGRPKFVLRKCPALQGRVRLCAGHWIALPTALCGIAARIGLDQHQTRGAARLGCKLKASAGG